MTDRTATINHSDGSPSVSFPILTGTLGPEVIDIRTLYGKTGKFTYDPGFLSTASCSSAITYIDGDKGELLYRGYPIEELAVRCDFLEVCYLLLYGELPTLEQKDKFVDVVTKHTMVNEQMQFFMRGFRRDAHPMAVLTGLVGAMSAFYPDSINLQDAHQRDISAVRLIAKMPTLVAMSYKYSVGQPYMYPRNDLSYAANFTRMMFATPCEDWKPNDVLVRALDRIFILHARSRAERVDVHGAHVRVVRHQSVSPRSRPGVACLWGPGARRRQRGRAQHALRNPEAGRLWRRSASSSPRQGQVVVGEAHGLRPSRVQELRPAREAHARDRATRCWASSGSATIRCSSSRCRSRRSRSRTTISSAASCTRTWTSTRASCRRPSASRCSSSRRSSRWRAPSAGSRS
jgi:hypothetical protein